MGSAFALAIRRSRDDHNHNGDLLILVIQSDEPGVDQISLGLTVDDKRYVGLPFD